MSKNPEDSREKAPRKKKNPDLPNQDDGVQEGRKEVKEKVSFVDLEAQILEEQLEAIRQNPQALEHLSISQKSRLDGGSTLGVCERMALEAYSAQPYVLPKKYQNPEDIDFFYDFLPIRPSLFPDALFEHLFDIKFKKSRNTVDGALERKEYYPLLRSVLSTLKPISFKPEGRAHKIQSNRVFVISDPEFHGLLISRVPEQQKINNYYTDVYSAIRSQKHIKRQYVDPNLGEVEGLKQMRYKVQDIIALLQNWKYTSSAERDEIKSLITDLEDLLKMDINENKKKARSQFETAKTLKDKQLDRINPSSTSARLVGSFNQLQKRAASIFGIMNHTGADLDLLERMRESMEITFNKARLYLNVILDNDYFKPFDEQPGGAGYIKSRAKAINRELYDKPKNASPRGMTVTLKALEENKGTPTPFGLWAEAALSNLRVVYKLNNDIAEGRIPRSNVRLTHDRICTYALRAKLALEYQKMQRIFAEFLEEILDNPESINVNKTRDKFQKFLKEDKYPHLEEFLKELISLTPDSDDERDYRCKIYDKIKSFDFTALINLLTVKFLV